MIESTVLSGSATRNLLATILACTRRWHVKTCSVTSRPWLALPLSTKAPWLVLAIPTQLSCLTRAAMALDSLVGTSAASHGQIHIFHGYNLSEQVDCLR
ncbi:hypothetical protein O181_001084 [Austropuccinia psidii MF-1]|uniref:Uncharacterized protein n=1 Tax=Austropuccinia psidii MF-1 TaxID=1389203 RepID=A0A9Q3B9U1_9BASI|nr:hypothetical protein [Austropuccinia psidii MF-1]